MSTESTSPKKKTTKKVSKKKAATDVDTIFDLAMQGMLVVQVGLAITALLFEIEFANNDANDVATTFLLATILSYIAIIAIVYSLSLQIGDDKKSPVTRIFAFVYYIVILFVLYIAAADPAGGLLGILGGGA